MALEYDLVKAIRDEIATPFYLYSAEGLDRRCKDIMKTLGAYSEIFYSVKANPNQAIIRRICRHGLGCEVSSCGELLAALNAGVDPKEIIFLGPAKTNKEIDCCLHNGVGTIVVENIEELSLVDRLAYGHRVSQKIALRINPAFSTTAKLTMSGRPTQFGIDEDQIPHALSVASRCKSLQLSGIHVYMGTRILDPTSIVKNTNRILDLAFSLVNEFNLQLEFVDAGGGFGVPYFNGEKALDLDDLSGQLEQIVQSFYRRLPSCRVSFELGRFLTAEFGTLVLSVVSIKECKGRVFAICDGGINCHQAAGGMTFPFRRHFPIRSLRKKSTNELVNYSIVGPLCTPTDVLAENIKLPRLTIGDILVVENSGAYGPSFSPTSFLSFGWPSEILLQGGDPILIRRCDSIEDLHRCQVFESVFSDER